MKKALLFLWVFGCTSLAAQNIELAWQPHAVTQIGLVKAVSGGTITCTNTPHPEGNFYPQLMKIDTNGTILWVTEFQTFEYLIHFWVLDVEERSNGELWLTYNSFDCDFPAPSGIIRFSASGDYIEHWALPEQDEFRGYPIFQDTSLSAPLVFWKGTNLNEFTLFRWSDFNAEPVALPVVVNQKKPPTLLRQQNGRIVYSDNNALNVFDPATGTTSQTLTLLSHPINHICEGANNNLYVTSDSIIWHLDQDGQILNEQLYSFHSLSTIWYLNDYVYVKDNISKEENEIYVFSANLTPLHTLSRFTSDTKLEGVALNAQRILVWGNETYNGFIKEVNADGSYAPLVQDAAILDVNYGSIKTGADKNPDGYHNLQIILEDVNVLIENKGTAPLTHLNVNWNKLVLPPLPPNCTHFEFEHPLANLNLLPGESAWVPVPNVDFGVYYTVPSLPHAVLFSKCLSLSTPENDIDILHENDHFCFQISAVITDQENVVISTTPNIMPNPFAEVLYVHDIPENYKHVEVYNMLGQPVYEQSFESDFEMLSLPENQTGLMLLLFRDEKGQVIHQRTVIRTTK